MSDTAIVPTSPEQQFLAVCGERIYQSELPRVTTKSWYLTDAFTEETHRFTALSGYVLAVQHTREAWLPDTSKPICKSFDGLTGAVTGAVPAAGELEQLFINQPETVARSTSRLGGSCAVCPLNQWIKVNGKYQKMACSASTTLILLVYKPDIPTELLVTPIAVKIPVKSVKAWNALVKAFGSRPLREYRITLTVKEEKQDKNIFSSIVFGHAVEPVAEPLRSALRTIQTIFLERFVPYGAASDDAPLSDEEFEQRTLVPVAPVDEVLF